MRNRKIVFSLAVVFLLGMFLGPLHAAQGLIKEVNFEQGDGKAESVIFHLDGPWLPKVFALKGDNPRVVFDFMETSLSRSIPSIIDAQGIMIRKIRLGRHSNKTRVVIDLTAGGEFNFDQQFDEINNMLTIQLFPADFPEKEAAQAVVQQEITPAPVAAVVVTMPADDVVETVEPVAAVEPATVAAVEPEKTEVAVASMSSSVEEEGPVPDPLLYDVSFENTSDKGEMVLFKLNGFYPPTVSGEEEGTPLVICDFAGTRLDETVIKDQVIDGNFIKLVKVRQLESPNLIRVTLELIPSKNYDLQQVFFKEDNLFVIIVNSYDAPDTSK